MGIFWVLQLLSLVKIPSPYHTFWIVNDTSSRSCCTGCLALLQRCVFTYVYFFPCPFIFSPRGSGRYLQRYGNARRGCEGAPPIPRSFACAQRTVHAASGVFSRLFGNQSSSAAVGRSVTSTQGTEIAKRNKRNLNPVMVVVDLDSPPWLAITDEAESIAQRQREERGASLHHRTLI